MLFLCCRRYPLVLGLLIGCLAVPSALAQELWIVQLRNGRTAVGQMDAGTDGKYLILRSDGVVTQLETRWLWTDVESARRYSAATPPAPTRAKTSFAELFSAALRGRLRLRKTDEELAQWPWLDLSDVQERVAAHLTAGSDQATQDD